MATMKGAEMLRPEDDLAIRRLYAEYNHAIHRGDAEAWADCFTGDGRFSNRGTAVAGRPDLFGYASGWISDGGVRYWIDNLLLDATEAGANGMCYLAILKVGAAGEPPAVSLTGTYTDTLVKVDGDWKFASRHIERDT